MTECRSILEALATACDLSVEVVDTNFTEPKDWNAMSKAPRGKVVSYSQVEI
jgi:hypothetical protein